MAEAPIPAASKKKGKKKGSVGAKDDTGDAAVFGGRLDIEVDCAKGRLLKARSNFRAGDLILREKPVAFIFRGTSAGIPTPSQPLPPHALDLSAIAGRHSCSEELLRMVLELHTWLLSNANDSDCLYRLEQCQGPEPYLYATAKGLLSLECHLEQQPPDWRAAVQAATREMAAVLELDPASSLTLLSLAAAVNVNSYGILSPGGSSLGFCLLPCVGLLINHSCDPNCHYTFSEGVMAFRALRTILPGEEVTVSYIDTVVGTAARRATLLHTKHFLCRCNRCNAYDGAMQHVLEGRPMDLFDDDLLVELTVSTTKSKKAPAAPSSLAKAKSSINNSLLLADAYLDGLFCSVCGSSGVVLEHQTAEACAFAGCLLCGKKVDYSEAVLAKLRATATGNDIMAMAKKSASLEVLTMLQTWLLQVDPSFSQLANDLKVKPAKNGASQKGSNQRQKSMQLHPCHMLLIDAYTSLASILLHHGDSRGGAACIRRSLRTMDAVLSPHHPELVSLRLELASVLRVQAQGGGAGASREADELQAKCAASRSILYGPEHPLVEELAAKR